MDVNELLRRIRTVARYSGEPEEMEHALEMFIELDEWILKGGFLPAEWTHPAGKAEITVESGDPFTDQTKIGPAPY